MEPTYYTAINRDHDWLVYAATGSTSHEVVCRVGVGRKKLVAERIAACLNACAMYSTEAIASGEVTVVEWDQLQNLAANDAAARMGHESSGAEEK